MNLTPAEPPRTIARRGALACVLAAVFGVLWGICSTYVVAEPQSFGQLTVNLTSTMLITSAIACVVVTMDCLHQLARHGQGQER